MTSTRYKDAYDFDLNEKESIVSPLLSKGSGGDVELDLEGRAEPTPAELEPIVKRRYQRVAIWMILFLIMMTSAAVVRCHTRDWWNPVSSEVAIARGDSNGLDSGGHATRTRFSSNIGYTGPTPSKSG